MQIQQHIQLSSAKNQQLIEAVRQIPAEAARQSNVLTDIKQELSAAADADAQMSESFNKFNQTLAKLNHTTAGQTEGITQMNKTFAASDRYLKYLISKQNKRLVWVMLTALGVCVLAIFLFVGVVLYVKQ